MMAFQCAHVYFFWVLIFGMLLIGVSFRRYNSMDINVISVSADLRSNQTSSAQPKGIEQQLLPGDQQVSYPWIGDSTCQHLAVQVSEIIKYFSKIKKIIYKDNTIWFVIVWEGQNPSEMGVDFFSRKWSDVDTSTHRRCYRVS